MAELDNNAANGLEIAARLPTMNQLNWRQT